MALIDECNFRKKEILFLKFKETSSHFNLLFHFLLFCSLLIYNTFGLSTANFLKITHVMCRSLITLVIDFWFWVDSCIPFSHYKKVKSVILNVTLLIISLTLYCSNVHVIFSVLSIDFFLHITMFTSHFIFNIELSINLMNDFLWNDDFKIML